jgi:large subunit ribosomal protein L4
MAQITVRTAAGDTNGTVELSDAVFGIQPNVPVMHQVVTAQLAKRRAGTQSTKTRAEVSGGGKKPYKQKGTGNARQGSTRAPHWSGGGVALGPKPRKYDQKTPKKMIRLALHSALSDRATEGKVLVVDGWSWDEPRTKDAKAALEALGIAGKALVVVTRDDEVAIKAFRNLPDVQLIDIGELNTYDVLCNDWIVFTQETLPGTADGAAEANATTEVAGADDAAAPESDEVVAVDDSTENLDTADAESTDDTAAESTDDTEDEG